MAVLSTDPFPLTCAHHRAHRWLFQRPRAWLWATQSSALEAFGFVIGPIRTLPEPVANVMVNTTSTITDLSDALSLLAWQQLPGGRGESAVQILPLPRVAPSIRCSLILHVRHPLEAMVSHFFCVTDATICPRRRALLAAAGRPTGSYQYNRASYQYNRAGGRTQHLENETMANQTAAPYAHAHAHAYADVEAFLTAELRGPDHTSSNQLLLRYERL